MKLLLNFATACVLFAAHLSALAARIPMYVTYSEPATDYFMTTVASQRDISMYTYGYQNQGVFFYVDDVPRATNTPLYRLYKYVPETNHYYTTNAAERDWLVSLGWTYEGVEGYVFTSQIPGSAPIYQAVWVDPNTDDTNHIDTLDFATISSLMGRGWRYEGILGYAFRSADIDPYYAASVIVYHTGDFGPGDCSIPYAIPTEQMATDLDNLFANEFTVVPVKWLIDWAAGIRYSMPPKPVAITLDDGYSLDVQDTASNPNCPGKQISSALTVLTNKANQYPGLFADQPYATAFVIASPQARAAIGSGLADDWWQQTKQGGKIDIQNHSTDHDHPQIPATPALYEYVYPYNGIRLAVGGLQNDNWSGENTFCRTGTPGFYDTYGTQSAYQEIVLAATFIEAKTGSRPDLFAAPRGGVSPYIANFWQSYPHGVSAAFGITGQYVRRGSLDRYNIPRWVGKCDWHSATGLIGILGGGGRENPSEPPCHVPC